MSPQCDESGQSGESGERSAPAAPAVGTHPEVEKALAAAAHATRQAEAEPETVPTIEPDAGSGVSRRAVDATRRWTASVIGAAQGLLASDLSDAFNDLTQAAVDGPATVYDKAMDAEYLATHIGGANHRYFDGGHTISGAWQAARDASDGDTLMEEMLGTVQGLLRDVSTPRGLPLGNWDKDTFDTVAESLQSSFGIPKSWFADLVSYDAAELLGSTVGVASMIFNWNKADTETFASLAASMGLSAALSANPLLLPVSVVAMARAFHKAQSGGSFADIADGALKGGVASGASMGAVALVGVAGGPAGVALLAGLSAAALAHATTKNVQIAAVHEFVRNDSAKVLEQFADWAGNVSSTAARQAARAGRAAWTGTKDAGNAMADSASTAVRSGVEAATAAYSAVESATQRAKTLLDRDAPEQTEHDENVDGETHCA